MIAPHQGFNRFYFSTRSRVWNSLGISSSKLIGAGPGNGIVTTARGRMTLEETLKNVSQNQWQGPLDAKKLKAVLMEVSQNESPIFLEIGGRGALGNAITSFNGDMPKFEVITAFGTSSGSLLHGMAKLFVAGAKIDWEKFYEGKLHYRVELPTYPLEKTSCWIGTAGVQQTRQPVCTRKGP